MIRKLITLSSAAALVGGLALAAVPSAGAATNVVTCTPGPSSSVVKVAPAMVNNTSPDAAFGLGLTTVVDNCVANAAQLDAWVPSKLGTPAAIAAAATKAVVQLKAKGFGTCNFATPDPAAYPANGQLKIKWTDGAGITSKMKGSQAIVRVSGDLMTASAVADGIVSKGTGQGADIHVSTGFDLANPINGPVLACNTGVYSGPSITQIGLANLGSDTLTIDFP